MGDHAVILPRQHVIPFLEAPDGEFTARPDEDSPAIFVLGSVGNQPQSVHVGLPESSGDINWCAVRRGDRRRRTTNQDRSLPRIDARQ
jgi:hypothetical protein